MASERCSGLTTLAIAAIASENDEKATPSPVTSPPTRYNMTGASTIDIAYMPSAYAIAPVTMTTMGPKRSESAPATGTPRPQIMFWIAMANAKVSRSQPRVTVMGSRNRPKLARMP